MGTPDVTLLGEPYTGLLTKACISMGKNLCPTLATVKVLPGSFEYSERKKDVISSIGFKPVWVISNIIISSVGPNRFFLKLSVF